MSFERNAPYAPTTDNRPAALDRGPLALTRDAGWQMSFGERAALEGILAQVRPRVALEVGTAEGASLARIAAYSAEVHSIDLTHEPVTRELPPHVLCHTGASADLLPPLLASFAEAGKPLDFALLDGDHSYEGIRADLTALLDSPVTARSVMLVHDTMNAEVRAGLESLALEDYEKLVYHEPEFLPGYMFRDGACRGAIWGGLGLLITDTDRSQAYPLGSSRQSRYFELCGPLQRMKDDLLRE